MAPDTKVPDGQNDGLQRQNNIPPPMAGDKKVQDAAIKDGKLTQSGNNF